MYSWAICLIKFTTTITKHLMMDTMQFKALRYKHGHNNDWIWTVQISFTSKFCTSLGHRILILYQLHFNLHLKISFILVFHHRHFLIIFLNIVLRSFISTFLLDTGLTGQVVEMVGEICHFAYIDGESPKYLGTVDEWFVIRQ